MVRNWLPLHLTRISSSISVSPFDLLPKKKSALNDAIPKTLKSAFSKPDTKKIDQFNIKVKKSDKNETSIKALHSILFPSGFHPSMSAFNIVSTGNQRITKLTTNIPKQISLSKPRTKNLTEGDTRLPLKELMNRTEPHILSKNHSSSCTIAPSSIPTKCEKRSAPESNNENFEFIEGKEGEGFQCKYCGGLFETGQALGGHMSRKHSGKSIKYNHKKFVREKREFERMRLFVAKKKYLSNWITFTLK